MKEDHKIVPATRPNVMKSTLRSFTNADSVSPPVMKAAPVTMATRQLHLLLMIPVTGPKTDEKGKFAEF